MDVQTYLKRLNKELQNIFDQSLAFQNELGKAHHYSACIFDFSKHVPDDPEKKILLAVSTQLESATLSATMGLYRQAFSCLRLAFELGLGAVYFSAYKVELNEWLSGSGDIKWGTIIDEDNGVLSTRFVRAFNNEVAPEVLEYRTKATLIYRKLSEYVHGNSGTWDKNGLAISFNENLLGQYFVIFEEVANVILFALCCRYLKSLKIESLDSLEFLSDEFRHLQNIREQLGGPKEIK